MAQLFKAHLFSAYLELVRISVTILCPFSEVFCQIGCSSVSTQSEKHFYARKINTINNL